MLLSIDFNSTQQFKLKKKLILGVEYIIQVNFYLMKYNTDQKNMILYVKGDSVRNILDPRCELIIIQIIIAFSYRVQSVVDEKGLMLSLLILAVLYESHNGDGTF